MAKYAGAKVKALREQRRLSQVQLAASSRGVSRSTIVQLEKGLFVKLDTLLVIAKALGLKRDERLDLVRDWLRDCLGEDLWSEFSVQVRKR